MRRGLFAGLCVTWAICLCIVAGAAGAAAPANDDFASAEVISGALPLAATGTTVGATSEAGEPTPPYVDPAGHSIWFRWQAPTTETVSLDVCNAEERNVLAAVYTGSSLGALTEVAGNRDGVAPRAPCWGGGEEAIFTAHAGTVYSIWVDGSGFGATAPTAGEEPIELELSRTTPPANDGFAAAKPLFLEESVYWPGTERASFSIDNWGATKEAGEPDHRGDPGGASVWFQWTAPRTGGVFVQTSGGLTSDKPLLAVYTGASVSTLTPVPQIEDFSGGDYMFFAEAGTTYRIAVDGGFVAAADEADMFEISGSLAYVPPNDDFEDATSLVNPITGTPDIDAIEADNRTVGATKQPGEPDHDGNPGGHSVWFRWTAPETGSVQLSACGANFANLLAAYEGAVLSRLNPVASGSSDAGSFCSIGNLTDEIGNLGGEIGFNIQQGVTYDIAVDGVDGAWGHFDLELEASDQPLKQPPSEALPTPPHAKAPRTKIAHRKVDRKARSITIRLGASVSGSTYRCKLDAHAYRRCGAKVTYRRLAAGHHTFRAYAVGPTGLRDKTPVKVTFRVPRPPRVHPRG
jgi:hypothetical protein